MTKNILNNLITPMDIVKRTFLDEFRLYVIYGDLRIGKSSYASTVTGNVYNGKFEPNGNFNVYNSPEDWDLETFKSTWVWKPEQFIELIKRLKKERKEKGIWSLKQKMFVWDDAGFWLFALDYADPLIKALTRFFNIIGVLVGGMVVTTPHPNMIIKKLRIIPNVRTVKIIKNIDDTARWRKAKVYRTWEAPDLKHSGVRTEYVDNFKALFPKHIYEWYKPLRDDYVSDALSLVDRELNKVIEAKSTSPSMKKTLTDIDENMM